MNSVNIMGGFQVAQLLSPPKYVEAPLAGSKFERLPTLEEVVEKSFQQYLNLVNEREARRIMREHETWGRLLKGGRFKVRSISSPLRLFSKV